MHSDKTQRTWVIRGFHFRIIENKHWLPSGPISLFGCESLDGLVHDELRELTPEAVLDAIEVALPEWIERTRSSGRDIPQRDPTDTIEEAMS